MEKVEAGTKTFYIQHAKSDCMMSVGPRLEVEAFKVVGDSPLVHPNLPAGQSFSVDIYWHPTAYGADYKFYYIKDVQCMVSSLEKLAQLGLRALHRVGLRCQCVTSTQWQGVRGCIHIFFIYIYLFLSIDGEASNCPAACLAESAWQHHVEPPAVTMLPVK